MLRSLVSISINMVHIFCNQRGTFLCNRKFKTSTHLLTHFFDKHVIVMSQKYILTVYPSICSQSFDVVTLNRNATFCIDYYTYNAHTFQAFIPAWHTELLLTKTKRISGYKTIALFFLWPFFIYQNNINISGRLRYMSLF